MNLTANPTLTPSLGAGPYAAGKREAIRVFYEDYFTLDGDAEATLARVEAGRATEAFKAGFRETLARLGDAVREG